MQEMQGRVNMEGEIQRCQLVAIIVMTIAATGSVNANTHAHAADVIASS